MRIFILALGTRGDLEPFWALGRALAAAGHLVTLGTSGFHIQPDAALRWLRIGSGSLESFKALLRSLAAEPDRDRRSLAFGRRWAMPQVYESPEVLTSAVAQHDYFIGNMKFPLLISGAVFPGAFVSYDPPESVHAVQATSGLTHDGRTLDLVAMPQALVDPQAQWGENFHFTGFWRTGRSDIARPQALADFLSAGAPPVVLTMGSMLTFDAAVLTRCFEAALRALGQRGVVVSGWSGQAAGCSSDGRLLTVAEADYTWLFGRAACVIHHGGVGTVASVLAAGVPQVLLPQVASQVRWGEILVRERLCTSVLSTEALDAYRLAGAIRQALESVEVRHSARNWASRVMASDGIGEAVDAIAQHIARLQARRILPR